MYILKHTYFIMDSIATDYKKVIFMTLIRELEHVNIKEASIAFMVRDVNCSKNCELVCKHYDFLKKHFHLPRNTRQPQKIVSQVLIAMFKCCGYEYNKSTKCYYKDTLKTTSGYYETTCV